MVRRIISKILINQCRQFFVTRSAVCKPQQLLKSISWHVKVFRILTTSHQNCAKHFLKYLLNCPRLSQRLLWSHMCKHALFLYFLAVVASLPLDVCDSFCSSIVQYFRLKLIGHLRLMISQRLQEFVCLNILVICSYRLIACFFHKVYSYKQPNGLKCVSYPLYEISRLSQNSPGVNVFPNVSEKC